MGPQIVRLRRAVEGSIVGRTNVREALILTTWAETGAGIRYGFEFNTYWTHWMAMVARRIDSNATLADVQDHGIIASAGQKDLATIGLNRRQ